MTAKDKINPEDKKLQYLEEICDNTRAIRRVVNRILDQMHECQDYLDTRCDPEFSHWQDLDDADDMYL